jgi:hypothetical protein
LSIATFPAGGTVDVEHAPERLTVQSPGGLVAGVTPDNILTHPSTPRHRLLGDAGWKVAMDKSVDHDLTDRVERVVGQRELSTAREVEWPRLGSPVDEFE